MCFCVFVRVCVMESETKENETASSLKTTKILRQSEQYKCVTSSETIRVTRRFRITGAHDPQSGERYDVAAMLAAKLIDVEAATYRVPDGTSAPRRLIDLDTAVELGHVSVELVDQLVERANQHSEYVEEQLTATRLPLSPPPKLSSCSTLPNARRRSPSTLRSVCGRQVRFSLLCVRACVCVCVIR